MHTYYVRHTRELHVDDSTRHRLWKERKIAIHFPWGKSGPSADLPDSSSLNPSDYSETDSRAVRALTELAKNGGYVCAEYYGREECLLGSIAPNSKIELVSDVWGNRNRWTGRQAILKA